MAAKSTLRVWVKLKDCDGRMREPTSVRLQSDDFIDDVIKACLDVSKVNIAPNLVKVFSAADSTDPIDVTMTVDDLIKSNRGTTSSPLFLECPQYQVILRLSNI